MGSKTIKIKCTTAQHHFTCQMDFHKSDVEMIDCMCSKKAVEKLVEGGIPDKYQYLKQDLRLKNENLSSDLVTHLKGFVYASLIKQFHDYVMEYFRTVLRLIANNPNKGCVLLDLRRACHKEGYKSPDFSFTEDEIMKASDISQLKDLFAKRVLRRLEQKQDSLDLIKALYKMLGKDVTSTVDDAMPYLEMRHLLVHNAGWLDREFVSRYGKYFNDLKEGRRIKLNCRMMKDAAKRLRALVREVDKFVVEGKFVRDEDIWDPDSSEEKQAASDCQTNEME